MSDLTATELRPTVLRTVKQTAERLGMTEPALRWLIHEGRGPRSFVLEGRRKFRDADIEAYIAEAFGDDVA